MAETYRPVLSRKAAKAIFTVLTVGMTNTSLPKEDTRLVLLFMNKISEWETMAAFLERLGKQLPDFDEQKQAPKTQPIRELTFDESENKFVDWDDEALDHFLLIHPTDPKAAWVQEEIARRVRIKEQKYRQTRPPQPTDEESQ